MSGKPIWHGDRAFMYWVPKLRPRSLQKRSASPRSTGRLAYRRDIGRVFATPLVVVDVALEPTPASLFGGDVVLRSPVAPAPRIAEESVQGVEHPGPAFHPACDLLLF